MSSNRSWFLILQGDKVSNFYRFSRGEFGSVHTGLLILELLFFGPLGNFLAGLFSPIISSNDFSNIGLGILLFGDWKDYC